MIFSEFSGSDIYTTIESERVVRLPLFYNMNITDINKVIDLIYAFFDQVRGSDLKNE
ncbi:dTDP-4-amino-4,6-dideoxygalactose transaminase [compost metagenome]